MGFAGYNPPGPLSAQRPWILDRRIFCTVLLFYYETHATTPPLKHFTQ
jgi:hypothetical protein